MVVPKSKLERAANIAVIATCVVFSAHLGIRIYGTLRSTPVRLDSTYNRGDVIKDSPELGLKSAESNLLLVTRSTCHFCRASMPFYQRLTETARKAGARVVAVSAEDPAANRAFLLANGVQVDTVASLSESGLKQSPTPTLILIRGNGKVVNSWVGQLPSDREAEVIRAVNGK